MTHDYVEIYMDDFITCGHEFDKSLASLEKALIRYKEYNVPLINLKCQMMLTNRIVPRYYISTKGIQADPVKIKVILNFPTPHSKK